MTPYRIHNVASAPERSKSALEELQRAFGFIPNVAGVMAESPVLISAFVGLFQQVHAGTFTEAQIQVLLLANAVTNRCAWAVALHSTLALQQGVVAADVEALRDRRTPDDARYAGLAALTRALIENRGHIGENDLTAFRRAGFGQHQVLEVVAVLAASAMTNYCGNIAKPPLEAAFRAQTWAA